jgi:hypothetical protein
MFEQYPDASNVESRIGATNASGKPKWIISPNFRHIAEIGTDQARYILGDIEAAPVTESPAVKAFKEEGYVLNPKTAAWEKPESSKRRSRSSQLPKLRPYGATGANRSG